VLNVEGRWVQRVGTVLLLDTDGIGGKEVKKRREPSPYSGSEKITIGTKPE